MLVPMTSSDREGRYTTGQGQTFPEDLRNYAPTIWPKTTKFGIITHVGDGHVSRGSDTPHILRGRVQTSPQIFWGRPIIYSCYSHRTCSRWRREFVCVCTMQIARCGRILWVYSVERSTSGTQRRLGLNRLLTMTWTCRRKIIRRCLLVNTISAKLIVRVRASVVIGLCTSVKWYMMLQEIVTAAFCLIVKYSDLTLVVCHKEGHPAL